MLMGIFAMGTREMVNMSLTFLLSDNLGFRICSKALCSLSSVFCGEGIILPETKWAMS